MGGKPCPGSPELEKCNTYKNGAFLEKQTKPTRGLLRTDYLATK